MRLSFPNLPDLGRVFVALKAPRWRDPLVQVWGLIGVVLAAGMATYYVRRNGDGEKKNASWEQTLLRPGGEDEWHPEVLFADGGAGLSPSKGNGQTLNLRACAETAAACKTWKYLPAALRREISAMRSPARRVAVCWSGTRGGDASALSFYFARVRDENHGVPGEFVIGNGHRSRDGMIETTARWQFPGAGMPEEVSICLAGDGSRATPAQLAALGELINCIESRGGSLALSVHEPFARELLAYAPAETSAIPP